MLLDRAARKDSHPDVLPYRPLRNVTIGIATMVGEATNAPAFGGIDELGSMLQQQGVHSQSQATHLILLQHHKVEVSYTLLRV